MRQYRPVFSAPLLIAALLSVAVPLSGCTTTPPAAASKTSATDKASTINSQVDSTLERLYRTVPGSRTVVDRSKGVLVFPSELSAGYIVGGSYGEGALRVGGHTAGYYRAASASLGLQAGAQTRAVVIVFMTDEALSNFQNSKGWTVGGDATVAVAKMGANGQVDTNTFNKPVVAFTLTNVGLMAGVSLEGTKISRINM